MSDGEQDVQLAESFASVARVLLDERDVEATLERICKLAVETIPGCETAGISIAERTRVTSRSRTDDIPQIVDEIQSQTQQGPCVDAINEHGVFITGSLLDEQRWPDFARRAHQKSGVQSILSVCLFASEDTLGALNLYSSRQNAFDDHDIAVASVFAAHAAVALVHSRNKEHLEAKAASRNVIGVAKGIIVAQQNVTEDEAFDILRRASQRMNIKLRTVAERVAHPTDDDTVETN